MVRNLSIVNLLLIVLLLVLLYTISERWWFSAALTYLPRSPFVLPSLLLLACSVRCHRRSIWVNVLTALLVVGPVMGLKLPLASLVATPASSTSLKVVSCNVQHYEPNLAAVLTEIAVLNPDVVAFQEARFEHPLLAEFFKDWHTVQEEEFWVGSRFPVRLLGKCAGVAFDRDTAISVEVSAPQRTFRLFNVHQTTPRRSLTELDPGSLISGAGQRRVERHLVLREEESHTTRVFVADTDPSTPYLVVGDFNMPTSSNLFQTYWGDLTNAFDVTGCGYGYTSPCRRHRAWPDFFPWIRIDHILASEHWCVQGCRVGRGNGSDHRLIAATLQLEGATNP